MAIPAAFKEKMKEKSEVREGEEDTRSESKKKAQKKKDDTEIASGREGVTKSNDKRRKGKQGQQSLDDSETTEDACSSKKVADGSYKKSSEDTDELKKDGKKKKGKDCGCTHKNDSLTPQEYIAACNLGIQDRSRVYIRARLDSEQRADLGGKGTGKKCGNSHIPRAATCNKTAGGATKKPSGGSSGGGPRLKDLKGFSGKKQAARANFANAKASTKGVKRKAMQVAEVAANVGSIAKFGQGYVNSLRGRYGAAAQNYLSAGALGSLASSSKAARMGNRALSRDFRNQTGQLLAAKGGVGLLQQAAGGGIRATPQNKRRAAAAGRAVGSAYASIRNPIASMSRSSSNASFKAEQRARGFRKYKRPAGGGLAKRDNMWAQGFSVTDAETALTAEAMNLATDKYRGEKRKRNAQGQPHNVIYANTFNT